MFSVELECGAEERDLLAAELWEQGCEGIVETGGTRLRAFFPDSTDRAALLERFARHRPQWRVEEDRDWVEEARSRLKPITVGARFFLVPEWRDDPAPESRFRIMVNPGMAFGTGAHETTQLCLEALERHVKRGAAVLDVGTGSGILAEAAALLGAARVWACDVDTDAVALARAKAPAIYVGSVNAVRARAVDLVVANISPEAIRDLAAELMRVLRPGGTALLSGFEAHEATQVQSAFGAGGTVVVKGPWALIEIKNGG